MTRAAKEVDSFGVYGGVSAYSSLIPAEDDVISAIVAEVHYKKYVHRL